MAVVGDIAVGDKRLGDPEINPGGKLHRLITSDEEILKAVVNHVGLDSSEEAQAIYAEARRGNQVGQFIVGMALLKAGREEAATPWFDLSAAQGFEPAKQHLRKAG
ncbi:MAG: hypothetical protein ROO76_14660 [Terriglobia bacterium]|nr:hypothetical protein [Terriglobia bacterium]